MSYTIKYILITLLLTFAVKLQGQNLSGAFFMEGFADGHEMNPAKDFNHKGFFCLPLLGNLYAGINGNFGIKDFFINDPSGRHSLTTILNPNISESEALNGLSKTNKMVFNLRYDILNFGFHKWKGYNTFSVSLRANGGVCLPYELFETAKSLTNRDYQIGEANANATAWSELSFGHSHHVSRNWRIGGKFKILFAMGRANLQMKDLEMNLSNPYQWTATANANLELSLKQAEWGEMEKKKYLNQYADHTVYEQINFDEVDIGSGKFGIGLNGRGMAVDLGTEWVMNNICEGLKLSASLIDLGFLKWNHTIKAENKGEPFLFEGFQQISIQNGPGMRIEEQVDNIGDRLSDLYSLQDAGTVSNTTLLGATLHIGLDYNLACYKKLCFGLLSTTNIHGPYSWNEERICAYIEPLHSFEFGTNICFGTFGTNFGWIINIHPKGFNIFLGMDHLIGKFSKQGIPIKKNNSINIGINFPLDSSV